MLAEFRAQAANSMQLMGAAAAFLRLTQPPLQLFRGNHETFNRLVLDESIYNLGNVDDRDAPVEKVIGFD